ncbi:hypothetical protein MED222_06160 [Vibrio sp. MED222]|nr:hypothetical protein MED222_06160 [Vibrio sp. MED222]
MPWLLIDTNKRRTLYESFLGLFLILSIKH